jgi:uncharacterized protein (DUF433 family)
MTSLICADDLRRHNSAHSLLSDVAERPNHRTFDDSVWRFTDSHDSELESEGKDFDIPFSSVLKSAAEQFPSITMDVDVLGGSPRIDGTRIPVYMILRAVGYFGTLMDATSEYPSLTLDDIKDALRFAADVMEQPIEHDAKNFAG